MSYKGELTLRSSRSFIQPAMFDLETEAVGEGGGEGLKKKTFPHPYPYPYFWPSTNPVSPQPSAVIKIEYGFHNFANT